MKPVDPRLFRHARAARGYLVVTVGLGLAVTGLILAQAGLLAHAMAHPGGGVLIALLVVVAVRAVAVYGGEITALRAATAVKSQLRRRLVSHALALGPGRTGEVATLATRGLDALDAYFARYLPQLVLACIVPIAVLVRIGGADLDSALIIALTLPLIPVFAILVGLHTRAQTERQWTLLARLGGHFLDVVQGLPTLKIFNRAKAQAEVVRQITDAHRRATMRTLRVAFLSALVLELAATLATALVAVEVGLRLLDGHLPYETALLVLILAPEAYLPLRNVGAQFHASMEGVTAAREAFDILETPPPAAGGRDTVDLRHATISFDGAGLTYPGRDAPAITGVTLAIAPGERIAVTGASGAGKTTLLAMLLRFVDADTGTVRVGSSDLGDLDVEAWRRQIAWVPQHPHLFATTVADNIRLGRPEAPFADVVRAAHLANAAEFIDDLPADYDTPLGERGERLSAGQRQRIALARAYLRDAPLLLLDEPTAHLDPQSAAAVRDAVERLMAGRSVIVVSHGHGWADAADRVVELAEGQVVRATPLRDEPCPAVLHTAAREGRPPHAAARGEDPDTPAQAGEPPQTAAHAEHPHTTARKGEPHPATHAEPPHTPAQAGEPYAAVNGAGS